jgi:hypothetical protein
MDTKDVYAFLVKHDERLKNIYSVLNRVEKHLEKLNGRVENHERSIAKMQVLGTVAVVSLPIIINIIMRIL